MNDIKKGSVVEVLGTWSDLMMVEKIEGDKVIFTTGDYAHLSKVRLAEPEDVTEVALISRAIAELESIHGNERQVIYSIQVSEHLVYLMCDVGYVDSKCKPAHEWRIDRGTIDFGYNITKAIEFIIKKANQ